MIDRRANKFEWPTVALVICVYSGFAFGTTWLYSFWPPLGIALVIVTMTLHSSLTHEILHGHPFSNQFLNVALVFPSLSFFIPYLRFSDLHLAHHTHRARAAYAQQACRTGQAAPAAAGEPAPCRTAVGQAAAERRPCDVPTPRVGREFMCDASMRMFSVSRGLNAWLQLAYVPILCVQGPSPDRQNYMSQHTISARTVPRAPPLCTRHRSARIEAETCTASEPPSAATAVATLRVA